MANKGFNGSTFSFASSVIGTLKGLTVDVKASEIDITAAGDSLHTYEVGLPDTELSVEVIGGTILAIGTKGAVAVAWFDGTTTGTLTKGVVTSANVKGSVDGEISATYKIKATV